MGAWRREILVDGTVRLQSGSAVFLLTRLRPGALLASVVGNIDGLGNGPGLEFEAELQRFRKPMAVLIDLSRAHGAGSATRDRWSRWFTVQRDWLERVTLYAPGSDVRLVLSVARHLARAESVVEIFEDAAGFDAAVAREYPGFVRPEPTLLASELALGLERSIDSAGNVAVAGGSGLFRISTPASGLVRMEFEGIESVALASEALDEVVNLARASGPIHLFVDLARATDLGLRSQELWSAWVQAQRQHLRSAHVLVGSRYLQLALAAVHELNRTGDLVRIHADRRPFEETQQLRLIG